MSGADDALFPGFAAQRISTSGAQIHCVVGGAGPPLLLLHGYPQTHAMWHRIAPRLAERHTVVCPDLRGYGDSSKPAGGAGHVGYSKRAMAADQVELMRALGFARFRLAGHDRGARVAHRLCLDHADAVVRVAMLDISPTRIMYGRTDKAFATAYYHWFFLIQPFDLPERLIGADPAFYLRRKLAGWSSGIEHFDARAGRIRALFQRSGDDSCELRGLPRRGGDATLSRNVGERNCGARQDAGRSIGEAALPLPCRSMQRSVCRRLRHHGRRRRTLTAPFAAA